MLLTGLYNGIEIAEGLLLLGGFLVQLAIAMVLSSLPLTRRVGRPVTFLAAIVTTGTLLSSPPTDMDDTFHLVIEIVALKAIPWTAWTWPKHEHAVPQSDASSSKKCVRTADIPNEYRKQQDVGKNAFRRCG